MVLLRIDVFEYFFETFDSFGLFVFDFSCSILLDFFKLIDEKFFFKNQAYSRNFFSWKKVFVQKFHFVI